MICAVPVRWVVDKNKTEAITELVDYWNGHKSSGICSMLLNFDVQRLFASASIRSHLHSVEPEEGKNAVDGRGQRPGSLGSSSPKASLMDVLGTSLKVVECISDVKTSSRVRLSTCAIFSSIPWWGPLLDYFVQFKVTF